MGDWSEVIAAMQVQRRMFDPQNVIMPNCRCTPLWSRYSSMLLVYIHVSRVLIIQENVGSWLDSRGRIDRACHRLESEAKRRKKWSAGKPCEVFSLMRQER